MLLVIIIIIYYYGAVKLSECETIKKLTTQGAKG